MQACARACVRLDRKKSNTINKRNRRTTEADEGKRITKRGGSGRYFPTLQHWRRGAGSRLVDTRARISDESRVCTGGAAEIGDTETDRSAAVC